MGGTRGRGERPDEWGILEAVGEGVVVQDRSGELVYANEPAATMLGFSSVDDVLRSPPEEVARRLVLREPSGEPIAGGDVPGMIALEGAEPPESLLRWTDPETARERWAAVRTTPVFADGGEVRFAVSVLRDITDRRAAEEEIAKRARQQAAVAELGHFAITSPDPSETAARAADLVAETLEVQLTAVLELLPHGQGFVLRAGTGWKDGLVGETTVSAGPSSHAGFTLLSREPVVLEDLRAEARFSGSPIVRDHGVVSGVCVPIPGTNRAFGALAAYTTSRRGFSDDEIHFLESTANVLATAIERKGAEVARVDLLSRERAAREAAEGARKRVAFLAEASEILSASLDYMKTLQKVADLVVARLADWCAIDVVGDEELEQVAMAHVDPAKVEWAREYRRRNPLDPDAPSGTPRVVRTGEPELYHEIPEPLVDEATGDEEALRQIRAVAPRSAMVIPLWARGRTFGAITFASAESDRRYTAEDLSFAEDLARRASLAIDNARLYRERSHVARTLQRSLLPPELPPVPGMEVAARYHSAAEESLVGGDFYDLFESAGGGWTAVVGDVCGRGVEAAALTGMVRHTLRALGGRGEAPSRTLLALNEAMIPQTSDRRFCTVALARLMPGEGGARIAVSVGGHPPPMVLRAEGSVERVGEPGTLLGLFPGPELADREAELGPGDALVMFTDGVTEAFGDEGEASLAGLLRASVRLEADKIAEAIAAGATNAREGSLRDDIAVLVLRLVP